MYDVGRDNCLTEWGYLQVAAYSATLTPWAVRMLTYEVDFLSVNENTIGVKDPNDLILRKLIAA